MPVEDVFRYNVELDTQGLAAQLAAVRDTVQQGMGAAVGGVPGGITLAGRAGNQISSDLALGQQLLSASIPAQMLALPPGGIATTTLGQIPMIGQAPGAPQPGLIQDILAATGATRAPTGVFPAQFQAAGQMRLQERLQAGIGGVAQAGAGLAGAAVGQALIPIPIVGAVAGYVLGETLFAPFVSAAQERVADRARISQLFGFNTFNSDQRAVAADFMRQRAVKSIMSSDEFNTVLPAAMMGGFFAGVRRGDVEGFQGAFARAEEFFAENALVLGVTGPEGIMQQGEILRGLRRGGVRDLATQQGMLLQSRVLSQQMRAMGTFVSPMEVMQQQMAVGQGALQFGIAPRRAMEVFRNQAAITNQMVATQAISADDLALLGGTPGEAAQRMTMALMQTQRQPMFRAMALAFGSVDPVTGRAEVSGDALEQMAEGRVSFSALSERMVQQMGTGRAGTTRMMTLMANEDKLRSDMLVSQRGMLMGLTDEFLRQGNMEVTTGTRQFILQRVFGMGEPESRALVAGQPLKDAALQQLRKDEQKLQADVAHAIETQKGSLSHKLDVLTGTIKDFIGGKLDDIARPISETIAPALEGVPDKLDNINKTIQGLGGLRRGSPIEAGALMSTPGADQWMHPGDPNMSPIFRAVTESRAFPMGMVQAQAMPELLGLPHRLIPVATEGTGAGA